MKWYKFRLKTTVEAEEIVASMLMDMGIEGVEIDNAIPLTEQEQAQMFADVAPEKPGADLETSYLNFYVEDGIDSGQLLVDIRTGLDELSTYLDVGDALVEVSLTEDVDWINNWKEHFHQFYVDDILITPSWEPVQAKDSDKIVLSIDPGTAFGTGMHETTQLCIRQLRKYVKVDDKVLDVGCGSGILSMLALKFGARRVVGTDLDSAAIAATCENMSINGLADKQYQVLAGNIIDDGDIQKAVGYETYDIVVANILADVLVLLTSVVSQHLVSGGLYITSGIIEDKEQVVVDKIKAVGMEIVEITRQGEWVSVTARK